ncbi:large neutral amino acids transporter small subunit 4-like isoform X2 [Branchiostoma floridae]|uniref:Large neutral amino acids transporter small subunit 4-like isoform X2 n=1 Tax=Branchiostoma floridae TaxID=7739 RepID=A0A9J7KPQ9_BRAFL|nr:large neutral amino acids transporter small subunit 4-like isoform X2 [Branchiostoma floridae]
MCFKAPSVEAVRRRRHFLLCSSILQIVLFSGILLGWANLLPVLRQEGVFSHLCDQDGANPTEDRRARPSYQAYKTPANKNSQNTFPPSAEPKFTRERQQLYLSEETLLTVTEPTAGQLTNKKVIVPDEFLDGNSEILEENASQKWKWRGVRYRPRLESSTTEIQTVREGRSAVHNRTDGTVTTCSAQEGQLSLAYTLGSFLLSGATLPGGIILDRFGARKTQIFCSILYGLSTLCFAFTTQETPHFLFLATSLSGAVALTILVAQLQVANLYSQNRALVLGTFSGLFASSCTVFFIFSKLYERGFDIHVMFYLWTGGAVVQFLSAIFLTPDDPILPPARGSDDSSSGESYSSGSSEKSSSNDVFRKGSKDQWLTTEVQTEPSARSLYLSPDYIWLLVWLSILQLKFFFMVAILNQQLNVLSEDDGSSVNWYLSCFAIVQGAGLPFSPLAGWVMDRGCKKPIAAPSFLVMYYRIQNIGHRLALHQDSNSNYNFNLVYSLKHDRRALELQLPDEHVDQKDQSRRIKNCAVSSLVTCCLGLVLCIADVIPVMQVQGAMSLLPGSQGPGQWKG